jgi:hypothetical protein
MDRFYNIDRRNVGLSRFMTAVEKVKYVANPDNPDQETVAIKEAW